MPKESDFYERRILSNRFQLEVAVEGSVAPKGRLKYQRGNESSEEMIARTIGLRPYKFGSGLPGCYCWEYGLMGSYQTAMECSHASPPVHRAKYIYYGNPRYHFPDYLYTSVRTEF